MPGDAKYRFNFDIHRWTAFQNQCRNDILMVEADRLRLPTSLNRKVTGMLSISESSHQGQFPWTSCLSSRIPRGGGVTSHRAGLSESTESQHLKRWPAVKYSSEFVCVSDEVIFRFGWPSQLSDVLNAGKTRYSG